MRILALTPLMAIFLAPLGLHAQAQEGAEEDGRALRPEVSRQIRQVEEEMRKEMARLQQQARGARLGVGLGRWEEGPAEGVSVMSVTPGGPAELAGLLYGDILLTIDGESLAAESGRESYEKLRGVLVEVEPGTEITIGYRRGDDELQAQVITDEWEHLVVESPRDGRVSVRGPRFAERLRDWSRNVSSWSSGDPRINVEVDVDEDGGQERRVVRVFRRPSGMLDFNEMAWRLEGLQIAELTPQMGEYFDTDQGLLVVRAPDNEEIGLEDGDVIQKIGGRVVNGARRATRILRSYEPGEEVELEVLRHKRRKTLRFELPESPGDRYGGQFPTPGTPLFPPQPTR